MQHPHLALLRSSPPEFWTPAVAGLLLSYFVFLFYVQLNWLTMPHSLLDQPCQLLPLWWSMVPAPWRRCAPRCTIHVSLCHYAICTAHRGTLDAVLTQVTVLLINGRGTPGPFAEPCMSLLYLPLPRRLDTLSLPYWSHMLFHVTELTNGCFRCLLER